MIHQLVLLTITLASYSVLGQSNSFGAASNFDIASFRAFASQATLPPRTAQPAQPIFQQQQRQQQPLFQQQQLQQQPRFQQQQLQPTLARGEVPRRAPATRQQQGARQQVGRGEAVPQDVVQTEKPKTVAILKQINE